MIRADLSLADEVFMTGTAAEVTPVRAVDDVELGVGDVTLEIQRRTSTWSTAARTQWSHWLDVVEVRRVASRTPEPRRAASTVATTRSWSSSVKRRAARQAEPAVEEAGTDVAAERRVRREDRLQVHRLPERPRLDVLGLEREADRLAVGAEGVGVDDDAREPARSTSRTPPRA